MTTDPAMPHPVPDASGRRPTRVMCVVGTRPEAIKMAPVILALRRSPWCECRVVSSGQHRELLDQVLEVFGISPDLDLRVMRPDQSLAGLTARLLHALDDALERLTPDVVLAQGDTTTVLCSGMAAFYRRVAFGHVEAGLRTGDIANPFPEEMNRLLTSRLARWHFAPTTAARAHLLHEGIADAQIHVTGNTVIDALRSVSARANAQHVLVRAGRRMVLITVHRRENFGPPMQAICAAIRQLARAWPEVDFLVPVHPNPNVRQVVHTALQGLPNVDLREPMDYLTFVAAMNQATLVLTDSGGVQEEAPALAKPVLVLRHETERPEAVSAGCARLVGSDTALIVSETSRLLASAEACEAMAPGVSPYGDGRAAERIVEVLRRESPP